MSLTVNAHLDKDTLIGAAVLGGTKECPQRFASITLGDVSLVVPLDAKDALLRLGVAVMGIYSQIKDAKDEPSTEPEVLPGDVNF